MCRWNRATRSRCVKLLQSAGFFRDCIFDKPKIFSELKMDFIFWFYARRAAAISFFLTHSVFESGEALIAVSISTYSGGDNRVEINFPPFSFFGSAALPPFGFSLISFLPFLLPPYPSPLPPPPHTSPPSNIPSP